MERITRPGLVLAICIAVAVTTVIVPQPSRAQAGPSITLQKTVAVDTGADVCGTDTALTVNAGTNVRYCFTAINDGDTTLTTHDLVDDQLGTVFEDLVVNLPPGAQVSVTAVDHIIETVTNTATWTAADAGNTVSVSAAASLTVTVPEPSLRLDKTVAIDTGDTSECATQTSLDVEPGTTVRYCFRATNTGGYTLNVHDIVDDHFGVVVTGLNYSLHPGEWVYTTLTATITETTTNTAIWTATSLRGRTASGTASATVTIRQPSITLEITVVDTGPEGCGTEDPLTVQADTAVLYCYHATNTGGYTFESHDLIDDQLGTILSGFPFVLQPGESIVITHPGFITETTTTTATWTGTTHQGGTASATAVVTVIVANNQTPAPDPPPPTPTPGSAPTIPSAQTGGRAFVPGLAAH